MKECRYCHTKYDDQLSNCPSCGANVVVSEEERAEKANLQMKETLNQSNSINRPGINKRKLIGIIAAAVVAVVLIIVVASAIGKGSKPNYDSPSYSGSTYTSDPQSQQTNNDNSALIERANTLYSKSDKNEFIEFVNANKSALSSDSDIMSKYATAVSSYRDGVLSDAEAAFNRGDYNTAVAIIDTGLNFLKSDPLLSSEGARYASYLPVDLTNLKPYYKGTYICIFQDGITDIQGNHYNTGINGNGDTWATDYEDLYAIWDINRDYSKLTATVIVDQNNSDSDLSATIRIYGDDKLLYEKEDVNTRTKAFTIEVDVSGITDLKIALWGGGHMGWHPIDANLVDVFLFKAET